MKVGLEMVAAPNQYRHSLVRLGYVVASGEYTSARPIGSCVTLLTTVP